MLLLTMVDDDWRGKIKEKVFWKSIWKQFYKFEKLKKKFGELKTIKFWTTQTGNTIITMGIELWLV